MTNSFCFNFDCKNVLATNTVYKVNWCDILTPETMSPPYCAESVVTSLVRVPGSGFDKNTETKCLDLSKVSSLATIVPVPRLPPALLAKPPMMNRKRRLQKEEKPLNHNHDHHQDAAKKKFRIIYMTPEELRKNVNRLSVVNTSSGQSFFYLKPKTPDPLLSTLSVAELKEKRDLLKRENEELQKELSMIKNKMKK